MSEESTKRPAKEWAREKSISPFALAGAEAHARWPLGILLTEEEFDTALCAFRDLTLQ